MPVNAKTKAGLMAAAFIVLPYSVNAAGLGKLTVLSGLGQPLSAEIELATAPNEDPTSFMIRLASAEAFKDAKIEFPSHLAAARFAIEKRANRSYIRVTTNQPINEPFIDMLVELSWPSGKMVKEFTALLDPADYTANTATSQAQQPVMVDLPKTTSKSTAKRKTKVVSKPAKISSEAQPKPEENPADSQSSQTSDYKVKRGDTLAAIAARNKATDVTLDQMLVGLYKANPTAFDRQNMNLLKVGSIIKMPDANEVKSLSAEDAHKEIKVQAENWQAYKQKLAGAVAANTQPAAASSNVASGKVTAKVEDKSAPAQAASKDIVKLSQAELGKATKDGQQIKSLQDKINALQDEAVAKDRTVKETAARLAELESMNKKLKQLLELKSSTGAKVEQQAVKEAAASKPEGVASKPVEQIASKPAEVVASVPVEVVASQPAKKNKKPKVVFMPEEPEPTLMDQVMQNLPLVGGGAGVIALLGGLLIWRRRRNVAFSDSIITGSDLRANTNIGSTGGAIINTGVTENSFLTDFSREGLGAIDTDEVDPIAEAEVYLAYGRDPQAEEILKDALAKDATRQEVRLKLMEIYFNRKDVGNFETHANELHDQTKAQGVHWAKAAEMGRILDPGNVMYGTDAGAEAEQPSSGLEGSQHQAEDVLGVAEEISPLASAAQEEEKPVADDNSLDFGGLPVFDLPVETQVPSVNEDVPELTQEEPAVAPEVPASDSSGMLDFDIGDLGFDTVEEHTAAPTLEPVPELTTEEDSLALSEVEDEPLEDLGGIELNTDDAPGEAAEELSASPADANLLDFDFDLGSDFGEPSKPEVPSSEAVAVQEAPPSLAVEEPATPSGDDFSLDLDSLSLDLGDVPDMEEPSLDATNADDPAATKLDLAKAYIEMGDNEGAKEILEEVLTEGSAQQQAEANRLLNTLS
ncbi:FimV/HubP family polar landmark protein [Leeia oryzae]|uniref:FimV/HubP family polar landmark protein n=1 Tax=Leeia oryzae TaxID=356662 RepID=UPI00039D4490|nr:FimV/HubP family polar landmark protein [Leeia oryzae]